MSTTPAAPAASAPTAPAGTASAAPATTVETPQTVTQLIAARPDKTSVTYFEKFLKATLPTTVKEARLLMQNLADGEEMAENQAKLAEELAVKRRQQQEAFSKQANVIFKMASSLPD